MTEYTVGDTVINVEEKLSEVFANGYALTGERVWYGDTRTHARRAAITEASNPTGMYAVEHGKGFGLTMEAAVLRALYSHHIATTHNLPPFKTPTGINEPLTPNLEDEQADSRFNQLFDASSEFVIAGNPDELYFTFETNDGPYRSVTARSIAGGAIKVMEDLTDAATAGHRMRNHLRSAGGITLPSTLFSPVLEAERLDASIRETN